jgi:hypothetical protein
MFWEVLGDMLKNQSPQKAQDGRGGIAPYQDIGLFLALLRFARLCHVLQFSA